MIGISKAAKIVMKIMEVGHWVAVALTAAAAVLSVAAPQWLGFVVDTEALKAGKEISAYGFEVTAANAAGEINYMTVLLFAIGSVIIFALMAMVFRNVYLIIKNSEASTPFQKDNIRMLKEIGIFYIAVPVVGLVMSTIIRLAVGADATEISIDQSGVITGIVVLCLTQYFAHGVQLEKDVDGLL